MEECFSAGHRFLIQAYILFYTLYIFFCSILQLVKVGGMVYIIAYSTFFAFYGGTC